MDDKSKSLIKAGAIPVPVISAIVLLAVQATMLNFIWDLVTSAAIFGLGFVAGKFGKIGGAG